MVCGLGGAQYTSTQVLHTRFATLFYRRFGEPLALGWHVEINFSTHG